MRWEKQNKPYIAVSIKRGAILQCKTEGYSRRTVATAIAAAEKHETVRDRGH